MTVQELIDKLMEIEEKNLPVYRVDSELDPYEIQHIKLEVEWSYEPRRIELS